jgi:hypothetical protein
VTSLEVQPQSKPQGSFFVQVHDLNTSLPSAEFPPVIPVYDKAAGKDFDRVLNAFPLNVASEIRFFLFRQRRQKPP